VVRLVVRLLLLGLAVGVGVLVYRYLHPSDETRIRQQVEALAMRFSKPAAEPAAAMAVKMQRFGELFADTCELDLQGFHGNGTFTSSEIVSHAARVRSGFHAVRLTFPDVVVRVETKTEAAATVTARLRVDHDPSRFTEDTREIICQLRKVDGVWRFAAFREEMVLKR